MILWRAWRPSSSLEDSGRRPGPSCRPSCGSVGHTVFAARNPEEALALATDHPVALLLTDVVMPGMSGWELYEQLRHRQPTVRALFMSGFNDDALLQRAVADSDTPFLQKPFAGPALARKVREVLDGPPPGALPS